MGIRFKKTIKLGSLLKVNISTGGVSLTAGKNGASINVGKKGTYLNLSPSVAGIKGTGVSYRKKLTGGYLDLLDKKITNKTSTIINKKEVDTSVIEEYEKQLEANINIHKYTDNVLTKDKFDSRINNLTNDSAKELYQLLIDGDEETIETSIGAYLNNLEIEYPVKASYELEDHTLYVDLDLPEIEDIEEKYPTVNNNEIVYKNKKESDIKKEYAQTIISLGIFLTANFFNRTSYIEQIVLSAYTSRRNNDGDLKDCYLYSIKYNRKEFESINLQDIDDAYSFILKFENRINMSSTYTFKDIKPFERESITKTNKLILDAIEGLKELGYKTNLINEILPELEKIKLDKAGDYIKEALKLIQKRS